MKIIFIFAFLASSGLARAEDCASYYDKTCNPPRTEPLEDGTALNYRGPPEQQVQANADNAVNNYRNYLLKQLNTPGSDIAKSFSKINFPPLERCVPTLARTCERSDESKVDAVVDVMLPEFSLLSPNGLNSKKVPWLTVQDFWAIATDTNLLYAANNFVQEGQRKLKDSTKFQRHYISNHLMPKIKASAIAVLNRLPDGPNKDSLIKQINGITTRFTDCSGGMLSPNAYYDPSTNRVSYCNSSLLQSRSLFFEISILAHELGHAIDPCRAQDGLSGTVILFPLIKCLRGQKSIRAQTRANSAPGRCTGNRDDQIGEAFADWMSAEVLADLTGSITLGLKNLPADKYAHGIINQWQGLCASAHTHFEVHPNDRDRFDVYTTNPTIQRRMGCTPNPSENYCDINTPAEEDTTSSETSI